jgi:hypothetical protein
MYHTPQVYCWLNHCVNDIKGSTFMAAVRRGWDGNQPGALRPYYDIWRQLGCSLTP